MCDTCSIMCDYDYEYISNYFVCNIPFLFASFFGWILNVLFFFCCCLVFTHMSEKYAPHRIYIFIHQIIWSQMVATIRMEYTRYTWHAFYCEYMKCSYTTYTPISQQRHQTIGLETWNSLLYVAVATKVAQ